MLFGYFQWTPYQECSGRVQHQVHFYSGQVSPGPTLSGLSAMSYTWVCVIALWCHRKTLMTTPDTISQDSQPPRATLRLGLLRDKQALVVESSSIFRPRRKRAQVLFLSNSVSVSEQGLWYKLGRWHWQVMRPLICKKNLVTGPNSWGDYGLTCHNAIKGLKVSNVHSPNVLVNNIIVIILHTNTVQGTWKGTKEAWDTVFLDTPEDSELGMYPSRFGQVIQLYYFATILSCIS